MLELVQRKGPQTWETMFKVASQRSDLFVTLDKVFCLSLRIWTHRALQFASLLTCCVITWYFYHGIPRFMGWRKGSILVMNNHIIFGCFLNARCVSSCILYCVAPLTSDLLTSWRLLLGFVGNVAQTCYKHCLMIHHRDPLSAQWYCCLQMDWWDDKNLGKQSPLHSRKPGWGNSIHSGYLVQILSTNI